jgi:hypothetical protein
VAHQRDGVFFLFLCQGMPALRELLYNSGAGLFRGRSLYRDSESREDVEASSERMWFAGDQAYSAFLRPPTPIDFYLT